MHNQEIHAEPPAIVVRYEQRKMDRDNTLKK